MKIQVCYITVDRTKIYRTYSSYEEYEEDKSQLIVDYKIIAIMVYES